MDIKDRISSRRAELGLTLEEVGKAVGVSKSAVQKWESGEIANMRRDKIAKLAIALQCSPAYLMGWQDDPMNKTPLTRDFVERIINEALNGQEITHEMLDAILPIIRAVAKSFKHD